MRVSSEMLTDDPVPAKPTIGYNHFYAPGDHGLGKMPVSSLGRQADPFAVMRERRNLVGCSNEGPMSYKFLEEEYDWDRARWSCMWEHGGDLARIASVDTVEQLQQLQVGMTEQTDMLANS
jgi:hypothetical protein